MIGINLLLSIVLSVSTGKNIATEPSFTFVPQIGHSGPVYSVAISPDGEFIVSGSGDSTIKIWRMRDGSLVRTLKGHSGSVLSIAVSPDGEFIVSGGGDGTIKVWRMRDGSLVRTLKDYFCRIYSIAISPDGEFIVSGNDEGMIKVWRMRDGSLVRTLWGHFGGITSVAISPDGEFIVSGSKDNVSGSSDNTIKVWRMRDGKLVGHSSWVRSVAISPDGEFIVSGSYDNTIKVWRMRDGKLVRTLKGHSGWVMSVAISPDGEFIVSGSNDRTVRVWRMRDGKLVRTLKGHSSRVRSVAISPDGEFIVSGSRDHTIKVWRMRDGKLVRTLKGHSGSVWSVAISPDGKFIVSGSRDQTIKVWRMRDGSLVRTLKGHSGWVTSVAISPDGKFIVSGSFDNTIKVWRLRDGSLVRTLKGHSDRVLSVAISPDGEFIVSGSYREIKVWRMRDGSLIRTLKGHSGWVRSVAISPDGEFIVSGSYDREIKVWRMRDGLSVRTLKAHSGSVWSVAISPDGEFIVSGSEDKTIKVWRLRDGELLATLAATPHGGWVAGAPNGLWDANESGAEKFVGVNRIGTLEIYRPGDPECDQFHYPGLLAYIWEHGEVPPARPTVAETTIVVSQPVRPVRPTVTETTIVISQPVRDTVPPVITLLYPDLSDIRVESGRAIEVVGVPTLPGQRFKIMGFVSDMSPIATVLINGYHVQTEPREGGVEFSAYYDLNPGIYQFHIVAVDKYGNKSSFRFKVEIESPELPEVYAVVAGVSDYSNDTLDLKYADDDAVMFAEFLKGPNVGAKEKNVRLLLNQNATRANIIKALKEVLIERAGHNDVVIVYLSLHGVPAGNLLYFVPYDADPHNIEGTGISNIDIMNLISRSAAGKVLLIFDACHAGGYDNLLAFMGGTRSQYSSEVARLLTEMKKARKGVGILASTSGSDFSYERSKWGGGHGVFTYYLVRGLRGEADADSDGFVRLGELFDFVRKKVVIETGGAQTPRLDGDLDEAMPLSVVIRR